MSPCSLYIFHQPTSLFLLIHQSQANPPSNELLTIWQGLTKWNDFALNLPNLTGVTFRVTKLSSDEDSFSTLSNLAPLTWKYNFPSWWNDQALLKCSNPLNILVGGEVYIWDLKTQDCLHRFHDDGCIRGTAIDISRNNRYLATGSDSGVVNVYK